MLCLSYIREGRVNLVKNKKDKIILSIIGVLICIGIFYLTLNLLELDKVFGYLISGSLFGFIIFVLLNKFKSN